MLEELCEQVALLSRRLTVVEQNTKELLGRANGMPAAIQSVKPTIAATEPPPQAEEKFVPAAQPAATKVIGKIKNADGKLVSGVRVKILGVNDKVVKETKTNRAGEMVCFLMPGTYKAEYFLENVIDSSVSFTIKGDEKVVRLAQPGG